MSQRIPPPKKKNPHPSHVPQVARIGRPTAQKKPRDTLFNDDMKTDYCSVAGWMGSLIVCFSTSKSAQKVAPLCLRHQKKHLFPFFSFLGRFWWITHWMSLEEMSFCGWLQDVFKNNNVAFAFGHPPPFASAQVGGVEHTRSCLFDEGQTACQTWNK